MAIGIVLPQTRGREASVKDLVITILAKEWPLSTRKIYHRISKVYSVSCTYQAVHKSVKGLVKEKVLVEKNREYCLDMNWLEQLRAFSDEVKQDYSSKNNPVSVSSTTLAFYSKYLDNYKNCLAGLLKPRIKGLPVLYCSKSELDSFGNRVMGIEKETVLKSLFESSDNLLVLGPSGAGKTTALMQAAYKFCRSDSRIPIIFNLSNFKGQSLLDIVHQKIFEVSGERMNEEFLVEALHKGSFVFFLDGLNEAYGSIMVSGEKLNRLDFVLDQLNSFCFSEKFKKNKFVVSSRNNSDPKGRFQVNAYELKPFTEHQIKAYLERRNLPRLFMELEDDKNLLDLCRNPLLLDMTMKVYTVEKILPSNKTKLYQSYFNDLIYRWETKVLKRPELIAVDLEGALSNLAFETVSSGTTFPLELFLKNVKSFCKAQGLDRKEEKQIITAAMKTNLILVTGSEARFGHHSFQEFFAAKQVFGQTQSKKALDMGFLRSLAERKCFLEPLIFLSGLLPDSTELVKTIFKINKFVAGECLISANKIEPETETRIVKDLILTVGEKDLSNVWYAVDLLNRLGSRATKQVVQEIEKGSDTDLKRRMYWVIGGIRDSSIDKFIEEKVSKETDEHNVVHFLLGLQEMASADRASLALPFLKHKNPIVKGDAFIALKKHELVNRPSKAKLKTTEELKAKLIGNLDSDQFWIKMHSILILGKLQAKSAINPLVNCLTDKDNSIQWYSALALSQINGPEVVDSLKLKINQSKSNQPVYKKALEVVENEVKDRKSLAKIWHFKK